MHSIYVSTYAVPFLGTPHHGSDIARMFSTVQRMVDAVLPKKILDTDSQLLNALREESETLQNITDQFAPLMKRFRIYFFWEQEKTDFPYSKAYVISIFFTFPLANSICANLLQVVDEASAAPILDNTERSGIGANHSDMCKFEDATAPGYRTVVAALMRYAREAPPLIMTRWSRAKNMLAAQRSMEASELL